MSPRVLAIFTGVTSASLFWLTLTLDVVGGRLFSLIHLFALHDPASLLLAAWAFALLGSIALRRRSPKLALALAWGAPIFSLLGAGHEILALHLGSLTFDFPEGEAVVLYLPRLAGATGMLAVTLLGLSIHLALADRR